MYLNYNIQIKKGKGIAFKAFLSPSEFVIK